MRKILAAMAISFMLMSCTYAISKETRQKAVMDVSLTSIIADVEKHKGSVFIFGGFIAKNHSTEEGSVLEIVQNPTDKYGTITDTDISQGRFLAIYNGTLDPLIYEKGRLVTIAGELRESRTGKIGQLEYTYPVFVVKEIYLWSEEAPYSYMAPPPYPWWWYDDPWRWWYGPYWP